MSDVYHITTTSEETFTGMMNRASLKSLMGSWHWRPIRGNGVTPDRTALRNSTLYMWMEMMK